MNAEEEANDFIVSQSPSGRMDSRKDTTVQLANAWPIMHVQDGKRQDMMPS